MRYGSRLKEACNAFSHTAAAGCADSNRHFDCPFQPLMFARVQGAVPCGTRLMLLRASRHLRAGLSCVAASQLGHRPALGFAKIRVNLGVSDSSIPNSFEIYEIALDFDAGDGVGQMGGG